MLAINPSIKLAVAASEAGPIIGVAVGVEEVLRGSVKVVHGGSVVGISATHLHDDLSWLFSEESGGGAAGGFTLTEPANSGIPSSSKPHTRGNFRDKLKYSTELDPGPEYQAHHVFPQKFEKIFESMKIYIHNPIYGEWWLKGGGPGQHQGESFG